MQWPVGGEVIVHHLVHHHHHAASRTEAEEFGSKTGEERRIALCLCNVRHHAVAAHAVEFAAGQSGAALESRFRHVIRNVDARRDCAAQASEQESLKVQLGLRNRFRIWADDRH